MEREACFGGLDDVKMANLFAFSLEFHTLISRVVGSKDEPTRRQQSAL
jgi:hypothetical protein